MQRKGSGRGITMKNIDDMRVGDFLYLIDTLQEECVSKRKCIMCRYHEICDNNDICSISTPDLKKAVEAYAEMNGLLDHMNYVSDQKWIPVSERLPKQNQTVIVTEDEEVKICTYELWYGYGYGFYGSRGNVTAWMPLPKAYEGEHK